LDGVLVNNTNTLYVKLVKHAVGLMSEHHRINCTDGLADGPLDNMDDHIHAYLPPDQDPILARIDTH